MGPGAVACRGGEEEATTDLLSAGIGVSVHAGVPAERRPIGSPCGRRGVVAGVSRVSIRRALRSGRDASAGAALTEGGAETGLAATCSVANRAMPPSAP